MAINTYTTIYDTNETMRILGQQSSCKYIGGGAIGYNDFKAVIEAHRAADSRNNDIFSIGIDFFMLGLIYGKKAERAEKQRKELKPLTTAAPKEELTAEQIVAELSAKPYLADFMLKVQNADLSQKELSFLTALLQQFSKKNNNMGA